jgi:demethylmenaquinone methyltransferase/2-methoxy-6-polyprenyl-1,4-benzoquinol methylase
VEIAMSAVQEMFDTIAPTYDTLNRVLSLGIDQSWRRRAVKMLGNVRGELVLDACAGTLDLSQIAVEQAGARVVAADFSQAMLLAGRHKAAADVVRADAMQLPFADGAFAGALCGFGLRNLPDARAGLVELRRVLRPGARLVILEFFRPRRTFTRVVQALYNQRVLPLVGGAISGDTAAYKYLASSIQKFHTLQEIAELAREAGFASAQGSDLTAGVASLLVARV